MITLQKITVLLLSAYLLSACVVTQAVASDDALKPVPELIAGVLIGYLAHEVIPDGIGLLPPPPTESDQQDLRAQGLKSPLACLNNTEEVQ